MKTRSGKFNKTVIGSKRLVLPVFNKKQKLQMRTLGSGIDKNEIIVLLQSLCSNKKAEKATAN